MRNDPYGFTIVEIMIVIAIIGFGLSFALPSFKDSTSWTKTKQTEINLEKINTALNYYKSEYGVNSIPKGINDSKHHTEVLKKLQGLLLTEAIDPNTLKSKGNGKTFYFTEYGPHKLKNKEPYIAQDKPSFKWRTPEKNKNYEESIPKPTTNKNKPNPNAQSPHNLVESLEEFIEKRQRRQAKIEKVVYFENPGSAQWIVPDGINSITVEAVGAGGSGEKAWIQSQWLPPKKLSHIHNRRGCDPCGGGYYTSGNLGSGTFNGPGRFKTVGVAMPSNHSVTINFYKGKAKIESRTIQGSAISSFSYDILEQGPIQFEILYQVPQGHRASNCNFHNITFEEYIQTVNPNGGGGAGGYIRKTLRGLFGGETLHLQIGQGSLNSNGGNTSAKLNTHTIVCNGGLKANGRQFGAGGSSSGADATSAGQPGAHADNGGAGGQGALKASSGLSYRGSGGNGDNSSGSPGEHGMVKITYKG